MAKTGKNDCQNASKEQKRAAADIAIDVEEITSADDGFDIEEIETPDQANAKTDADDLALRDVPDYRELSRTHKELSQKSTRTPEEDKQLEHAGRVLSAMDDLIAQIDMNDDMSIINFGSDIYEELEEVSKTILKKAERDGLFKSEIQDMQDAIAGLDWEKFNANADKWIKIQSIDIDEQADGIAGRLYKSPVGGFFAGLGVEKAKKTRAIHEVIKDGVISDQQIEEDLRATSIKLNKLRTVLNEADYKIPSEMKNLTKLAQARLRVYNKMSLYIGAANEKRLRFIETDLEDVKQMAGDQDSVLNQEKYEEVMQSYDTLSARLMDMETSRAVFITSTQALRTLKYEYEMAHEKIKMHKEESLPYWSASLKQVAQVLRLSELDEAITEAEEMADKMLKRNERLNQSATDKAAKNNGATNDDLDKAIESVNKQAAQLKALAEHTMRLKESKHNVESKLVENIGQLVASRADNLSRRALQLEDKSGPRAPAQEPRKQSAAAKPEEKPKRKGLAEDFNEAAQGKKRPNEKAPASPEQRQKKGSSHGPSQGYK